MVTENLSLAKAQQKTKPNIEDIMNENLDGDILKNALGFVGFLRANKMTPRWTATNAWWVKYKGKNLISIRVGPKELVSWGYGLVARSWHIGHWNLHEWFLNHPEKYHELINCDNFKAFVWAHLYPCKHCMCCAPGHDGVYLGKKFNSVCGFRVENPEIDELELAKKLLECKKNMIAESVSK